MPYAGGRAVTGTSELFPRQPANATASVFNKILVTVDQLVIARTFYLFSSIYQKNQGAISREFQRNRYASDSGSIPTCHLSNEDPNNLAEDEERLNLALKQRPLHPLSDA